MDNNLIEKIPQRVAQPARIRPIVLIGAGGIVRDAHLPAYRQRNFPVVGVYDLDHAKATQLAHDFEIATVFPTLGEAMVDSADVIFDIAVPASALTGLLPHLPDGATTLIQKPMGEDLAEARAILDLCRAKNLTAAINFQLRYAPYVMAARHLIAQGAIGTLHDMEVRVNVETPWHLWSFLEGIPRLEILYHSIHYVDLLRSFLGDPSGVHAKTVRYPGLDKLAATRTTISLDYGDFLRATITTNHHHTWGDRHQESYIKWEGTDGAIKCTLGSLIDYPHGIPDQFEYITKGDNVWRNVPVDGSWFPDAFGNIMSDFMHDPANAATAVDDAFKTMAVVEAAYQSSATGATPIPTYD